MRLIRDVTAEQPIYLANSMNRYVAIMVSLYVRMQLLTALACSGAGAEK